ncbi:mitochondrial holo-[acyl-carrier-protein] synthase Ppt2 [Schizosaccharomyces osmophilus]|uniref:Mitochondrial holo-[acyl-carrier-protein] synthase Ppt2 n=1 Tax=Schizosaccharomyces osmophilus TaxID=2545709 RepID=A0AAE9W8B5_9SCHI|nr:mitochondrial holo-[acyl-carrier-protein] synthase Ppt2 [Schizosaccharomyces osmophilus]WBW71230.1 mitochondrial holo-[acyl-carrier-protein] synthase Ppt2 [Schizosaccharomyces osmophilus]
MGIGIDILKVSRIRMLLEKSKFTESRFLEKCLHPKEIQQYRLLQGSQITQAQRAKWLGVRWSVKEATFKALQPSYYIYMPFMEYAHNKQGMPVINIHKPNVSITPVSVSVSHDGDYVVANALYLP